MNARSLWAVLMVVAAATASAHAALPGATSHWRGDVVVATVKKVSEHEATNGNPPTVELEVHEVLRGDAKTDRTNAVWQPRPLWSGECGVGVDVKKVTQAWEAKKLASPKVGDKFILWGEMSGDKKRPQFGGYSWEAYPFTDEKRTWAVKLLREMEAETRLQEEKAATAKKAKAQALAEWREKVSADDLKKYTSEADVVLVGRIVSWGNSDGTGRTFSTRILKETNRPKTASEQSSERYYLGLAVALGTPSTPARDKMYAEPALRPEVHERLDGETDYLLFLTVEQASTQLTHFRFQPIKTGEGIVIADRQAMEAVKEALGKK